MKIEIVVCDVCGRRVLGGLVDRFRAHVDGKLREWDVGGCCMDTPFRVCEQRNVDVVITVGSRS